MIQPAAIVYTSNTGHTAQYALLLAERIHLAAYPLSRIKELPKGTAVIYLGWLMAGTVKGYKKAARRFAISAVCGVGMGATGSQMTDVREKNAIAADVPVFTLQGGFDMQKLRGVYKLMMTMVAKTVGKKLAGQPQRSPDEDAMLEMLAHGGSYVSADNLAEVIAWYCENQESANPTPNILVV